MPPKTTSAIKRAGYVLFCALGLITVRWLMQSSPRPLNGIKDFMTFYVGAELVGTPHLYDEAYQMKRQEQLVGVNSDIIPYVRFPFLAWLYKPLAWFSYDQADKIWTGLIALSFAVFWWLFPVNRWHTLFALCWSVPVISCFRLGQDTSFLLVWIAFGIVLYQKGRPFLAGLAFSLCLQKFHFLVLAAIVVLVQRHWRMMWGAISGVAFFIALSFAVQGPTWPRDYFHMLVYGNSQPSARFMYNIREFFWRSPHNLAWHIAGSVIVAGLVWLISRRAPFAIAFSASLIGSLMISLHVFHQDYVLAFPLILLTFENFLNSPPPAVLLGVPFLYLWIPAVIIVCFGLLIWVAVDYETRARRKLGSDRLAGSTLIDSETR